MDIEREVVSYLYEFGNTKESDIIKFGVQRLKCPPEKMKRTIKQLAVKGELYYVVHRKLEPPEVYISLKEPLPPETAKVLLEALIQARTAEEETEKILEEAEAAAKRKIKQNL